MDIEHRVLLGVTSDGKHIAASTLAPYFCFEADTEAAVIEKSRRALAFHRERAISPVSERKVQSVTTLRPSRVLGAKELAFA